MYKQHAPFAVQIEMTQGCNLGCTFCGINAIGYQRQSRGLDFMTVRWAGHIATQMATANWCPRIEFAMHGEPTLNPDIASIVALFRHHLPKAYLMVTSNGGGLVKNATFSIGQLFDAGLNTLALDDYDGVKLVSHILKTYNGTVMQYHYPRDPLGNPHQRHRGQMITILADISKATKGTHSQLNNHAGSGAPVNDRGRGKRCAKPFRELAIRWNGDVAICCNDWPGYYRCGNVLNDGLLAVWHSPAMQAARQKLLRGQRDFTPCKGCDALSYRVGLLPDPLGKQTLPIPTAATERAIGAALGKGPYTKPVRPPLVQIKGAL